MLHDFYQPYFRAVQQILAGNPVENLEEIRAQCNAAFVESGSRQPEYLVEIIVSTFAADAENKILLGMDPDEAYKGSREPAIFRQRGRKVLEEAVQHFQ